MCVGVCVDSAVCVCVCEWSLMVVEGVADGGGGLGFVGSGF